jgi:hypothetical protein
VVLFNRFYEPIWQRPGDDGEWTVADPAERVPYERQEWFYGDEHSDKEKRQRAEAVLTEAGIPLPAPSRRGVAR